MVTIPGCQCDECLTRWIADVVDYAAFLEETVLEIEAAAAGGDGRVHRMIEALPAVAKPRALNAEIEAAVREEDQRNAAEARAMGRLN